MAFAPAHQIEQDVVGVEIVAVAPFHALTEIERVGRRVVIDVPAFEKPRLEGEIGGVADQRFEKGARKVAFLRPVESAWIVHAHDGLCDPDGAARSALRFGPARQRRAHQGVGRRRRHAERGGDGEEFPTRHAASADFGRVEPCFGVDGLTVDRVHWTAILLVAPYT